MEILTRGQFDSQLRCRDLLLCHVLRSDLLAVSRVRIVSPLLPSLHCSGLQSDQRRVLLDEGRLEFEARAIGDQRAGY